jgi:hypothetical protein
MVTQIQLTTTQIWIFLKNSLSHAKKIENMTTNAQLTVTKIQRMVTQIQLTMTQI